LSAVAENQNAAVFLMQAARHVLAQLVLAAPTVKKITQ
jgi:hypothetical protein